jgi:hypothetical protein
MPEPQALPCSLMSFSPASEEEVKKVIQKAPTKDSDTLHEFKMFRYTALITVFSGTMHVIKLF